MVDIGDLSTDRSGRREPIKSADRTIDVLEYIAQQSDRMTLSEIHRALEIPKSSLHGLLHTLVARGWVDTDNRGTTYGMGLGSLGSGTAFLDRDPTVQAAAALLAHLCREFDETMHLARLAGSDVVYLASRESRHHLRVKSLVGRRLPAHATALGQALLGTRHWEEATAILPRHLVRLTEATICERPALRSVMATSARRGFAMEMGQNTPDLVCVAVPIPRRGPSIDAISSSIPAGRAENAHIDAIVRALQQTAHDLSLINQGAHL